MSKGTLYDKIFDMHAVAVLPSGEIQLYADRHFLHEVTSPPAFGMLKDAGLKVRRPDLSYATLDHVIPTDDISRPFSNEMDEGLAAALESNTWEAGIPYLKPGSGEQGVCHVAFPEKGLIRPGMVAVCGDSHTCTYGAFGALAFGMGTTQVRDVLATQTVAASKLNVRKVEFRGKLQPGVTSKDMAIHMIKEIGVKGGLGFAYELCGDTVESLSMEARMTLCNMGVEGSARSVYINPDETTFKYLKERMDVDESRFEEMVEYWKSIASEPDAEYDAETVEFDSSKIKPMVTWGTDPGQAVAIREKMPAVNSFPPKRRKGAKEAFDYMGLTPGETIYGTPIDVVFIGSCTNGRLEDLTAAAEVFKTIKGKKKVRVRTLVVPGSEKVKKAAEEMGLAQIFQAAGAEWRYPGCSMCLAMNPDKLVNHQRSASTSNRNFKDRQGKTGRTHLMNPYMAAAAAIEGRIVDVRQMLRESRFK